MSFDGLGDMFGALSAEIVARKVEGCQRPVIVDIMADNYGTIRVPIASPPTR